ncbi:hypothetical protein DENSPDRAFT_838632 [Dentipellis sp. KUC8613]|nr:hypothetical protein DENSPDRAFT_838632 [Dentipellis sp. KUC8613]
MALVIEGFWTTLASPRPHPKHSRSIGTVQRHRISTSVVEERRLAAEEAGRMAAGERFRGRGSGTPASTTGGRVGCERSVRHRGTLPYDISKRATRALTTEQTAALLQLHELREGTSGTSSLISSREYSSGPWTRRSPSKGCNRLPRISEQDDMNTDSVQMFEDTSLVSLVPILPASALIKRRGGMTALESISEESEDEADQVKADGDDFDGVSSEKKTFSTAKNLTAKPRRTWMTTKFALSRAKRFPPHKIREITGCSGRLSRLGHSSDGTDDAYGSDE